MPVWGIHLYELARISYAIGSQFDRQITAIDGAFAVEAPHNQSIAMDNE